MHCTAKSVFVFLVMLQLSVYIVLYVFGLHRFIHKRTFSTDTYHEQRDLEEVYFYKGIKGINAKPQRLKRGETDAFIGVALENRLLCKSVSQVDLLLVVHSAAGNSDRRSILRTVLNKNPFYKTYTIRLLFLLGLKSDKKHHDKINQEFNQYGDIVQGRFVDAYRNLTYKAVMGLKWISHNCRNVKNVVKIDDDVYVDLDNFFSYVHHNINSTNCILCRVLYSRHAVTVNRRGKWAVQKYQFRHYNFFPVDYCSGFAVTMTGSIIPALYKATRLVPIFWVDDVFMYGMVRGFVASLDNLHPELYKFKLDEILKCFKEDKKCKVVFSHLYSRLILPLWQWRHDHLGHSAVS